MIKAAVMHGPGRPVSIEQFSDPKMDPGAVLLKTVYAEVCGTDVHLKHGRLDGVPYPIIPGHISVGRVEETSGTVHDVDGNPIVPGTTVTFLDVHGTCHQCWYCLVGKASTRCPQRKVYGVTHSSTEGLMGGWSEKIYLKPDVKILPLPDSVSPLRLIAGGCALPTAVHAVDRAEIRIGDVVVVQGAGPVGMSCAVLAALSGAKDVFIIDKSPARIAIAERFGFSRAIRIEPGEPKRHIEAILELTSGRGADVAIEATGVPSAIKEGIAMTRDGGRYVVVGHYTDTGSVEINPHTDINRKHLEIRGTWGIDFSHFHRMIGVLERHGKALGGAGWEDMIGRVYNLNDINQALDDVEQGTVVKAVIAPNGS